MEKAPNLAAFHDLQFSITTGGFGFHFHFPPSVIRIRFEAPSVQF